jgi:hypothetical protein
MEQLCPRHMAPRFLMCSSTLARLPILPLRRAQGSAAAFRDRHKYRANSGHQHAGYTFVPASVETYGYLGKPLVGYIQTLSAVVAGRTLGVSRGSVLASAYRELSVALVCSQGLVYRASANLVSKASGRPVVAGSEVPFLD